MCFVFWTVDVFMALHSPSWTPGCSRTFVGKKQARDSRCCFCESLCTYNTTVKIERRLKHQENAWNPPFDSWHLSFRKYTFTTLTQISFNVKHHFLSVPSHMKPASVVLMLNAGLSTRLMISSFVLSCHGKTINTRSWAHEIAFLKYTGLRY